MLARWRAAGLLIPTLMTLVMLPVLIGLGTWQLNRKAWKEDLIEKLAARPKAEPVSLQAALEQFQKTGEAEYVRVRVKGIFDHANERHLYAPTQDSLGWNIFTILRTEGPKSYLIYVNRGWVPDKLKDPASRPDGQVADVVTITGLLRAPEVKGRFTPQNDPKNNRWYSRVPSDMQWNDLPLEQRQRLLQEAKYQSVAPFSLDAEAEPANPGGWPKGGATFVQLSNRHLEYAVTWYGTALTLLGVFIVFARQRLTQISGDKPLQPE